MAFVSFVDEDRSPPITRAIFAEVRQQYGRVVNSQRVFAHNPDLLRALGPFSRAVLRENALPNRLKELAILKVGLINGCKY